MKATHVLTSAIAAAPFFSSQVALAHSGHGSMQGHIHAWGGESLIVLGVVLVLFFIACLRS